MAGRVTALTLIPHPSVLVEVTAPDAGICCLLLGLVYDLIRSAPTLLHMELQLKTADIRDYSDWYLQWEQQFLSCDLGVLL